MQEPLDTWAIVEVMGHRKYAGRVTEHQIGGSSFVRAEVPVTSSQPAFSKLFGIGSIYCITPIKQDLAMMVVENERVQPLSEYDLPEDWRLAMREGRKLLDAAPIGASATTSEPSDDWSGDEDEPA